jgi:hypothetical protein
VRFCIEFARKRHHVFCESLGQTLLLMSKTQRTKLYMSK